MGAPNIYRYDDDSAPICAGVNTSLVALLTACLVDGYGAKTGAGWTREFVNAEETKAVFRNNPVTGTGFYLQVDNTVAANYAEVMAYESMTDLDTGVEPFLSSQRYMMSSNIASTTERPWVLIADDRFFYLIVWASVSMASFTGQTSHYSVVLMFGDGVSLHQDDNYFCYLGAAQSASPTYCWVYSVNGADTVSTPYDFVARNSSGDIGESACAKCFGGGPITFNTHGYDGNGPSRIAGAEIFTRPFINDSAARTIRGYLPGYWTHCHKKEDFDNFEETAVQGHLFMTLNCSSYTNTSIISIDISENFRP